MTVGVDAKYEHHLSIPSCFQRLEIKQRDPEKRSTISAIAENLTQRIGENLTFERFCKARELE